MDGFEAEALELLDATGGARGGEDAAAGGPVKCGHAAAEVAAADHQDVVHVRRLLRKPLAPASGRGASAFLPSPPRGGQGLGVRGIVFVGRKHPSPPTPLP